MRTELTKEEYDRCFEGDLAEAFEGMIQQGLYFEVLVLNGRDRGDELIGRVETLPLGGDFYNASSYWHRVDVPVSDKHRNGFTYASSIAKEEGRITERYFAYDSLDDAIAHYTELLKTVQVSI